MVFVGSPLAGTSLASPYRLRAALDMMANVANALSLAGQAASTVFPLAAGAAGLAKVLGKELATAGVMVNCVTPAAAKTDIFAQMTQQHIDFMLSKIPMGRFGTTEEVAALVGWLCTEDCSFSTGAVFDLSGGRSTY